MTKSTPKISQEQFTIQAIENLRDEGYKGIHTWRSGFNQAFKAYYGEGADPVAATKQLAAKGVIAIAPAKSGVILYKKGEEPEWVRNLQKPEDPLRKILAKKAKG